MLAQFCQKKSMFWWKGQLGHVLVHGRVGSREEKDKQQVRRIFDFMRVCRNRKTHWHEVLMHQLSFHSSDGHWVSCNKNLIGMGLFNKRDLTVHGIYYV